MYYLEQNIRFLFILMKLSNRNSSCQQRVYNFRPNLGLNYSYFMYLQKLKGLCLKMAIQFQANLVVHSGLGPLPPLRRCSCPCGCILVLLLQLANVN